MCGVQPQFQRLRRERMAADDYTECLATEDADSKAPAASSDFGFRWLCQPLLCFSSGDRDGGLFFEREPFRDANTVSTWAARELES